MPCCLSSIRKIVNASMLPTVSFGDYISPVRSPKKIVLQSIYNKAQILSTTNLSTLPKKRLWSAKRVEKLFLVLEKLYLCSSIYFIFLCLCLMYTWHQLGISYYIYSMSGRHFAQMNCVTLIYTYMYF